jgi:hypothetical protein
LYVVGRNNSITYKRGSVGWSENGLDLSALLPDVTVDAPGVGAKYAPQVATTYEIRDASAYQWGRSLAQNLEADGVRFAQAVVPGVQTATYPSVSTEAAQINVTNPNAARSDNLYLFSRAHSPGLPVEHS